MKLYKIKLSTPDFLFNLFFLIFLVFSTSTALGTTESQRLRVVEKAVQSSFKVVEKAVQSSFKVVEKAVQSTTIGGRNCNNYLSLLKW